MTAIQKIRERLLINMVNWTKPFYVSWFKPKNVPWTQDKNSLLKYPPQTLGRALGEFLDHENLELMPNLEDHDVLHVLLHYQTTVVDEVRMQYFLLGNNKRSAYAIFTALVALIIVPEHLGVFRQEFNRGRQCIAISKWDFAHLLHEPVQCLRNQINGIINAEEAPFLI